MSDQHLLFFENFIALYQDIIAHDGYGDIEVRIRLRPGKKKEVRLRSGREYRYLVAAPSNGQAQKHYRIIEEPMHGGDYQGPERRSGRDRRDYGNPRRKQHRPRDFRLERRVNPDRRKGRGRRRDD